MKHWDKIVKNGNIFTVLHLLFYSHSLKYQGLKKRIIEVDKLFPYEGAHGKNKQFGLARHFSQKLNQSVCVKHPIRKMNLIKNPTKNLKKLSKTFPEWFCH